jgi:proline iminopeptidase
VIGSSVYYPRVFSQRLRARLQLIFLDLRHFAVTDPAYTPDHLTLDTYADDIEQARQRLHLGEVLVMGHSVHGTLALEYARRYPEQLRGVVAISTVPHLSDDIALARDRMWQAEASEERKAILARLQAQLTPELLATLSPTERFVRSYGARGPRLWYDATYDGSWLWDGVEFNMPVFERLDDTLLDTYDLAQGPGEITSPVLIAQGKYDFNCPYMLWEEHLHKLPRHTYVLFERSGHTPPFEEPDRFDDTLLAWAHGIESSNS